MTGRLLLLPWQLPKEGGRGKLKTGRERRVQGRRQRRRKTHQKKHQKKEKLQKEEKHQEKEKTQKEGQMRLVEKVAVLTPSVPKTRSARTGNLVKHITCLVSQISQSHLIRMLPRRKDFLSGTKEAGLLRMSRSEPRVHMVLCCNDP